MKFNFEAIGTGWSIEIPEKDFFSTPPNAEELFNKISDRIDEFDKTYSRFREDSLISKIRGTAGSYEFPDDAEFLFNFYKQLYDLTDGLFTPLIGNILEQAGYDKDYSLKTRELTAPLSWDKALNYSHPVLKIDSPVTLDFGAAGKGYLIDLVGNLLKDNGISYFTIDAGGDILHYGSELTIGLEDPNDETKAIGTLKLVSHQSIAGSSGSRRKWGDFHHIINPETLRSIQEVTAVWVVAETAMLADGLGTALFLKPKPEIFEQSFLFEYLILFADRTIKKSHGFAAELFFQ